MVLDKIIMNPPYSGNLHLKILSEAMKHADEIVNLSPIRWLEDPLAKYKKTPDLKKFSNVREHIADLEVIKSCDAQRLFDADIGVNLGIYTVNKNGGWTGPLKNELLDKMVKKVITGDTIDNHIVVDDMSGISCLITTIKRNYAKLMPFTLSLKKSFFTDGKNDFTGETYLEQRAKSAWGLQPKAENTNIKFSTKEERENFYNSWNTKPLLWLYNKERTDVHVQTKFLPWLGDYTHPWTDEMLYDYFNLTEEEREIIQKS